MIDPKMIEVIRKFDDEIFHGELDQYQVVEPLAQRLHNAGFRRVPSEDEIAGVLEYQKQGAPTMNRIISEEQITQLQADLRRLHRLNYNECIATCEAWDIALKELPLATTLDLTVIQRYECRQDDGMVSTNHGWGDVGEGDWVKFSDLATLQNEVAKTREL